MTKEEMEVIQALELLDAINAELTRLCAVNAELVEELEKLARLGNGNEYGNSDGNMIARAALSRAEQAKPEPETCVWTDSIARRSTACGIEYDPLGKHQPDLRFCPFCGKRVEVKG